MGIDSLIGCYAGAVIATMAVAGCASTVDLGTVQSASVLEPGSMGGAPSEVSGGANSTISGGASSVGAGGMPNGASGGNASAEAGICDPALFVSAVTGARAASNAPSGCIAPFTSPLAAPVRQATADFVRSVWNVSAASLQVGTESCGPVIGGNCVSFFDKALGEAGGGNLYDIIHPYSVHLDGCSTDLEQTDWTSTLNGITLGYVFCLSGHSAAGRVVGMCLFPQTTCP